MRLLSTILFILLLSSCHSQKRTILFINQSGVKIDSLQIGVSSANVITFKHVEIKASDSVITVIPGNKPKSNSHDITIFITISIKNHKLIYSYNYNDLAGYLDSDYTIILDKDKKIKWIPNLTSKEY